MPKQPLSIEVENALLDELTKYRAAVDLFLEYDRHRRDCTACVCGVYCPVEEEQWREIQKVLYRLEEE